MSTTNNATADLIGRNLAAGRGSKLAFIDDRGRYSYGISPIGSTGFRMRYTASIYAGRSDPLMFA